MFWGWGRWKSLNRGQVAECHAIRLHPAVRPQILAEYTASADVGMCLIEDTCLSYRYCMPNKLFEYFAAGVPLSLAACRKLRGSYHGPGLVGSLLTGRQRRCARSWSPSMLPRSLAAGWLSRVPALEYCWEKQVPALREVYLRLGLVAARLPDAGDVGVGCSGGSASLLQYRPGGAVGFRTNQPSCPLIIP